MTVEADKLRFTALNAIHNVTKIIVLRSAWLLWSIFINDLQVLPCVD